MGVKSVVQDAALLVPFALSLPGLWLWLVEGVSGSGRISDVMVGNGDASTGTSSLSSQRSMISTDEAFCCDAFGGAAVFGLPKKEESFDCPALSFFGFDVPVAEGSARGRLCESRGACDGLREAWLDGGDTRG